MSDSRRPKSPGSGQRKSAQESPIDEDAAPEVRACNELGIMLGSELAQVEEEINRVAGLISSAVTELSSSFDRLYHLSSTRQTAAQDVDSDDMEQAVSDAVRALQFEDIAAQALAEACRSVSYLRNVADEVRTVDDTGELAARISKQHRIWADRRRKAVSQKNLDKGSVDLF